MSTLPTGYAPFDTLTGGLHRIDVLLVATSPPTDGISLALSIALHAATISQRGVGLLSCSMNKVQAMQRLLAMHAGIDLHCVRTGQLKEDERQRAMAAAKELSGIRLWMDDPADLSLTDLRQRSRRFVVAHHVSLIVIDDLPCPRSSASGAPLEQRLQEAGEVGQFLRSLAHDAGIPVIACAPLAQAVRLSRWHASQRHRLHLHPRLLGAGHFLFLSREESPGIRHTSAFRVSMTREDSGLISELSLSG